MHLIVARVGSSTGPRYRVYGTARTKQTYLREDVKLHQAILLKHADPRQTRTTNNIHTGKCAQIRSTIATAPARISPK